MPQYSCRVLERRIQMIKKRIHRFNHIEKQAENIIMVNIAYDSQTKRSTITLESDSINAATTTTFSAKTNMNRIKLTPSLSYILCKYYNTCAVYLTIKCAASLRLGKHLTIIDSTFNLQPRKKKLSSHALVNCACRSPLPMLVQVLLIFQHKFSHVINDLALCRIYQTVTASISGIPECHYDNANSDTLNSAWNLASV